MQHINSTNEKGTCFADQLKRGVHIGGRPVSPGRVFSSFASHSFLMDTCLPGGLLSGVK